MRVAIIGAGISGLVAARLLHRRHQITVFEAGDYPGGHTHTVDVEWDGERHAIDTGFIVFNDRTYPNFRTLLDQLNVKSQPTEMSFSVRCDRTGLEYNGSTLRGLFAQKRNLFRPKFHRMVRDILRFNRESPEWLLRPVSGEATVEEYLSQHGYSQEFAEHYLLAMGSAIWSCPQGTFAKFPIRFVIEFYLHHGLLSLSDRPTWHVIPGGSREYVRALISSCRDRIRLRTPVVRVVRHSDSVLVRTEGGCEPFDEVVFACHSDQALQMLADPSPIESELLSAFPYERNVAVLHTDISLLPQRRAAWACWNYHLRADRPDRATVTYLMNQLQGLSSKTNYCVTLNEEEAIAPERVLGRYIYHHPIFTTKRAAAQRHHQAVIRVNRTSFCGAYWGNGFHEDGVNSALAVGLAFGETLSG